MEYGYMETFGKTVKACRISYVKFSRGSERIDHQQKSVQSFFFICARLVGCVVGWLVGWWGGRGGLHHRTWHSRNVGQRQGGDLVNLEGDFE